MFLIYSVTRKKSEVTCGVLMTEMYQQRIPLRVARPEDTNEDIDAKGQKVEPKAILQDTLVLWIWIINAGYAS